MQITIFLSNITRDGEYLDPYGIDVDSLGNAVRSQLCTCLMYRSLPTMVNLLQSGEATEPWMGEFNGPEGLVDSLDGYVYVTDLGNDLIRKFFSSR